MFKITLNENAQEGNKHEDLENFKSEQHSLDS